MIQLHRKNSTAGLALNERLKIAVRTKDSVQGYTHNFYRYPARFSPKFARESILSFSEPGDVVLDPFAGGGTTLVESLAHNRHSIGFDVNPIASFVSKAKTTFLPEESILQIIEWGKEVTTKRIRGFQTVATYYDEEGYLNNLPWTLRKAIEVILRDTDQLNDEAMRRFAKCVLLKTAQWAVDCRKTNPTVNEFRKKFSQQLDIFTRELRAFSVSAIKACTTNRLPSSYAVNRSSATLHTSPEFHKLPDKPKLIVTSPPYVGVHVLYHQWQVQSRKRTRVPFWIINSLDGQGSSFYTFGHYKGHGKSGYFDIAESVFQSARKVIHDDATVVQLVGFSDEKRYLTKYLQMMESAGYDEVCIQRDKANRNKRIWRDVPHRKWYASNNNISSGKEVLLIHKPKP